MSFKIVFIPLMGLWGRFGPLGEKWEKEKGEKGEQPHGPLGAHVGVRPPPWPASHVGISPTWLSQGGRLPLPTI